MNLPKDPHWPHELRLLWRLALPLVLVQMGFRLMSVVDSMLAGRLSETALAATGLGGAVFFAAAYLGVGVLMGLEPLAAQAFGAEQSAHARSTLWQGIYLALLISVPLAALTMLMAYGLESVGVAPELAAETRSYLHGRLWSYPPLLVGVALRNYLQAAERPRVILLGTIGANLANLLADALVVFGDDGLVAVGLPAVGLPRLGVFGLGFASGVSSVGMVCILAVAVRRFRDGVAGFERPAPSAAAIGQILAIGVPVGLQLLAEVGMFATTHALAGRIGVVATAAHTIALNYASLTFSACVGIGVAVAVRVGRALGRQDVAGARRSGMVGLGLAASLMLASGLLMWTFPHALARAITSEPQVLPVAVVLLRIAGFFQVVDGVQAVAAGALRGTGMTGFAFGANLVGHWGVGLPLGLYLAFVLDWGAAGLWWGLCGGLTFVACTLTMKFALVSRRPIASLVSER